MDRPRALPEVHHPVIVRKEHYPHVRGAAGSGLILDDAERMGGAVVVRAPSPIESPQSAEDSPAR